MGLGINLARELAQPLGDNLASSEATLYGFDNMTATNYFTTTGGGGTPGDAAGFFVAYWCRVFNVANTQFWATCANAAAGWSIRQFAATTLQFRCFNGVAASVTSPALTLTGLEDKVVAVMGLHTGTALRLYANRAQVGTETAIVGYTPPTGATGHAIGSQANSGCDFYGMVSGVGVPSLANFQSWCDLLKSGRRTVDMPGVGGQHKWSAGPIMGNIADTIGSSTMLRQGTGHTLKVNIAPTWAW